MENLQQYTKGHVYLITVMSATLLGLVMVAGVSLPIRLLMAVGTLAGTGSAVGIYFIKRRANLEKISRAKPLQRIPVYQKATRLAGLGLIGMVALGYLVLVIFNQPAATLGILIIVMAALEVVGATIDVAPTIIICGIRVFYLEKIERYRIDQSKRIGKFECWVTGLNLSHRFYSKATQRKFVKLFKSRFKIIDATRIY